MNWTETEYYLKGTGFITDVFWWYKKLGSRLCQLEQLAADSFCYHGAQSKLEVFVQSEGVKRRMSPTGNTTMEEASKLPTVTLEYQIAGSAIMPAILKTKLLIILSWLKSSTYLLESILDPCKRISDDKHWLRWWLGTRMSQKNFRPPYTHTWFCKKPQYRPPF